MNSLTRFFFVIYQIFEMCDNCRVGRRSGRVLSLSWAKLAGTEISWGHSSKHLRNSEMIMCNNWENEQLQFHFIDLIFRTDQSWDWIHFRKQHIANPRCWCSLLLLQVKKRQQAGDQWWNEAVTWDVNLRVLLIFVDLRHNTLYYQNQDWCDVYGLREKFSNACS